MMRAAVLALLVTAIPPAFGETLHYAINWPSGLSLGEASIGSEHKGEGWAFDGDIDASVPGFVIRDKFSSTADAGFCSSRLDKSSTHGSKKAKESVQFDQAKSTIVRLTEPTGPGGGKTEANVESCAKDALTYLQFVRRELAQGRVPQPTRVVFGARYDTRLVYAGTQSIKVDGKPTDVDKITASVKGPSSDLNIEIYFAKDAARTPVLARIPLALSAFTVELIH